ncbi:MAG: hypothetical protein ACK542_03130 [Burkholderiales bacterium]
MERLAYPIGGLAAQCAATLREVGLEFVKHTLHLPAFVIESRQFQRRRFLRIRQGGDQAVAFLRTRHTRQAVVDHAQRDLPGSALSRLGIRADDAQVRAILKFMVLKSLLRYPAS